MTNPDIKEIQLMLANAGFSPGEIDGLWGKNSRAALANALQKAVEAQPATDAAKVTRIIDTALVTLPAAMTSPEARLFLLTVSGQEADFRHRWQIHDAKRPDSMGAARGLWQFECMGATNGVLTHARTKTMAAQAATLAGLPATAQAVWGALHRDDHLAAVFARLLMWTNPHALPKIGDVEAAWQFYLNEWRPGAYWNKGVSRATKNALRNKFVGYYNEARKTLNL